MQRGHSSEAWLPGTQQKLISPVFTVAKTAAQHRVQGAAESGTSFGTLVQTLLFGAASRLERGRATCLRCQGSGTANCPSCKGGGVLKADKVKINQVRHAANKVQGMISGNHSMRDGRWQMSNRCRKCRGTGRCTCPTCQGLGVMDGN
eukprot:jgi/Astpho2/8229/Aster-01318